MRNEMRIVRLTCIPLFFLICILSHNGCTVKGVRETPAVQVVKEYASSVVNIRTERIVDLKQYPEWGQYGEQLDLFLKEYFGEDYSSGTLKHKSIGSGVILNRRGFIVTNAHVVQKATNIFIVMNDGSISEARIVEVDDIVDLALVKTNLPFAVRDVKLADIDDLRIGETVIAIGNPFGLENSVTVGVISGRDRAFTSPQCRYVCSGLLQTDASINPGNSGGALLNLDGELVGINLAVVLNAQSIGFAIPVDKVRSLLEKYR
jgi:serine protease Do